MGAALLLGCLGVCSAHVVAHGHGGDYDRFYDPYQLCDVSGNCTSCGDLTISDTGHSSLPSLFFNTSCLARKDFQWCYHLEATCSPMQLGVKPTSHEDGVLAYCPDPTERRVEPCLFRNATACPMLNMTVEMERFTQGFHIEAQMGAIPTFLVVVALMQIGGIPAPVDRLGLFFWSMWMLIQLVQLLLVFGNVILSVFEIKLVFDRLSFCTLQVPFLDWSLLSLFATTTSFFLPQVQIKCVTVIMYWLALYSGGRVFELRPKASSTDNVAESQTLSRQLSGGIDSTLSFVRSFTQRFTPPEAANREPAASAAASPPTSAPPSPPSSPRRPPQLDISSVDSVESQLATVDELDVNSHAAAPDMEEPSSSLPKPRDGDGYGGDGAGGGGDGDGEGVDDEGDRAAQRTRAKALVQFQLLKREEEIQLLKRDNRELRRALEKLRAHYSGGALKAGPVMTIFGALHVRLFVPLILLLLAVWVFTLAFPFAFFYIPVLLTNALFNALLARLLIELWVIANHHVLQVHTARRKTLLDVRNDLTGALTQLAMHKREVREPRLWSPSTWGRLLELTGRWVCIKLGRLKPAGERLDLFATEAAAADGGRADKVHKVALYLTPNEVRGDFYVPKVRFVPPMIDQLSFWQRLKHGFGRHLRYGAASVQEKDQLAAEEKEEAKRREAEVEQTFEQLLQYHVALTPDKWMLLHLAKLADSMLWWLEGRPRWLDGRGLRGLWPLIKLFSGFGVFWAFSQEARREKDLKRAAQEKEAREYMIQELKKDDHKEELVGMLKKEHQLRKRRKGGVESSVAMKNGNLNILALHHAAKTCQDAFRTRRMYRLGVRWEEAE